MPKHTGRILSVSFILSVAGLGATSVTAQEEYRHGHLRHVEPGVTLQRATEASAEEAVANLPFLPGDRVWTDAAGRVEFQFPEGTVVRLDIGSKLDYSDHDDSRDERVVLRLWSGSLILRATPESAIFEIETPGGLVQAAGRSVVRIDVEGGEARVSVYEGEASLDTGRDGVRLAAGQSTWARWGDAPAEPAPFDRYAQDDFAAWDGDLESRRSWAANSQRYLPETLEPYAPEFDNYGTWVYEQPVGYVWQPRVTAGWTPYSNGRWTWTSYGWTWVPYEPWGWVPHHYGRWGFSVSLGWYWAPDRVWGPGWVQWGYGGGYVGWCALGWRNRPVVPWRHHRGWAAPRQGRGHGRIKGYAVPRGSAAYDRAWTVVQRGDLHRGGYARRRVDPASVGGLHVAESVDQRPDRGVRGLSRVAATPRAATRHPQPGAASRARRGASPVPTGSVLRGSSSRGATSRAWTSARGRSAAGSASASRRGGATPGSSGSSASGARPRSGRSSGGVSSSPRTTGSASRRLLSRPRSSGSSSRGVSNRPRSSGSSSRGVSSRPRSSGSRSRGVSSRLRSSGSSSRGVSSRPRSSGSSSRGVSSRPRSSGSSSRGVSSRSRPSSGSSSSRSGSVRSRGSRTRH